MRPLHSIVWITAFAFYFSTPAHAESAGVHPDIGHKAPREMLNRDLLALPEREQQAWIHGAVTQTITIVSTNDSVTARCVADWYFTYETHAGDVLSILSEFPDAPATATLLSVMRRACPKV